MATSEEQLLERLLEHEVTLDTVSKFSALRVDVLGKTRPRLAKALLSGARDVIKYTYMSRAIRDYLLSRGVLASSEEHPDPYMAFDLYSLMYLDYRLARRLLRRRPRTLWQLVVRKLATSRIYKRVNLVTAGDPDLAKFMAILVLLLLLSRTGKKKLQQPLNIYCAGMSTEDCEATGEAIASKIAGHIEAASRRAREYQELRQEVEEALSILGVESIGLNTFSNEPLSILTYLASPETFRKRVRLLSSAARIFKEIYSSLPTSFSHAQDASRYGSIDGVEKMISEEDLYRLTPSELVYLGGALGEPGKLYAVTRLVEKQAQVYMPKASLVPVIYLDKSGSMDAALPGVMSIPKISLAAGLALALYKKYRARVYLFDTEIHPVPSHEVVRTLLTIRAAGNTSIKKVLEHVAGQRNTRDKIYIVVTDAIDQVPDETIKLIEQRHLAKKIRFILVPPAQQQSWLSAFKHYYAETLASFIKASRQVLQE